MKASSKHNHLNATTPRFRLDRDHCVGHVFLSVVYMPAMNYSCLYLTELRPIEKCVNLQHFVTERGNDRVCDVLRQVVMYCDDTFNVTRHRNVSERWEEIQSCISSVRQQDQTYGQTGKGVLDNICSYRNQSAKKRKHLFCCKRLN